ncbi:NDR1/HIN1-like protein 3 [Prunus avium]|uniref:NDR1/HIN1-like protein 3 n=1 Tax=Prunus avium TaxID=42229 RepID=A0A6P5TLW0_PRUAV|nr:NDR1/HIN1-like protein 3 [Prunus avium]
MAKCIGIILSTIGTLVVLGAISGFTSYLVFNGRTKHIRYEVFEASFTQFELANNNITLQYNLAINASATNPNKKGAYHFEQVMTVAYFGFKNNILSASTFERFDLPHNRVAYLASSENQALRVDLTADEVSKLRSATVFDMMWVASGRSSTKLGRRHTHFNYNAVCYLRVPLISDGKFAQRFNVTMCTVHKH